MSSRLDELHRSARLLGSRGALPELGGATPGPPPGATEYSFGPSPLGGEAGDGPEPVPIELPRYEPAGRTPVPPPPPPAGIPTVSLELDPALATGDPIDPITARLLPGRVCRHFRMLPVCFDGPRLVIAMADPGDAMARNVAFALTSDPLEIVLAPAHEIDAAIDRAWGDLVHVAASEPPQMQEVTGRRIGGILRHGGKVGEGVLVIALLIAAVASFVLAQPLTAVVLVALCATIYVLASVSKFKVLHD